MTVTELPAKMRADSGMIAKLSVVTRNATAVPRPNGCTRAATATCIRGTRLVRPMAAAQPIAAPVIPNLGMSTRSRPMLTPIASKPLYKLQLLRPAVMSTVSTCPHAVATSMAEPSMSITAAPAW